MRFLSIVILLLILALGDTNYETRYQATQALESMGYLASPYLEQGINYPDAEISRRCLYIKKSIDHKIIVWEKEEVIKLLNGNIPWIDTLPPTYPNRWEVIQEYQKEAPKEPWDMNKRAALEFLTDLLRNKTMTVSEMQILVRDMHLRGREWCKSNNKNYEEYKWTLQSP